jgi:hypothetical protein
LQQIVSCSSLFNIRYGYRVPHAAGNRFPDQNAGKHGTPAGSFELFSIKEKRVLYCSRFGLPLRAGLCVSIKNHLQQDSSEATRFPEGCWPGWSDRFTAAFDLKK